MTDAQYQALSRHIVAIERAITGIREVLKEYHPVIVPTDSRPR